MSDLALSAETLDALEKKHVEFLATRLVSDAAREDWIRSFREGWSWALSLRVKDVLDAEAVTDGVARALGETTIT